MQLLLGDKEIIDFLVYVATHGNNNNLLKQVKELEYADQNLADVVYWINEKKANGNLEKFKLKVPGKINRAVEQDLRVHFGKVSSIIEADRIRKEHVIKKKYEYFFNLLGIDNILKEYKKGPSTGFVKSVGLDIDKSAKFVRRSTYINSSEDCLLRNTTGNENYLVEKIDNHHPFWFIDSGYTNFLEGKSKKWHRLTRNHIHQLQTFEAPVDRLGIFKEFPRQWRHGGDTILVIEPGPFSAAIFHIDINQWKYNVESELRKYTDKKIKFRPKVGKKTRSSLYQELLNEDYYCIVNINSNAATESIWAGVPAITLDKHISNSVTRNRLSDINDLCRPNLANWLSMLSYSQFTYEELVNGTALKLVRKYNNV